MKSLPISQLALTAEIARRYSELSPAKTGSLISKHLMSPFLVEVKLSIFRQVEKFVKLIFELRENLSYQNEILSRPRSFEMQMNNPGNHSILDCFDFHLDLNCNPKLIEINTNAAFLALGSLMYDLRDIAQPVPDFRIEEVCENILAELSEFGGSTNSGGQPRIVIIDDQPQQQRLYLEFLIYQQIFRKAGFTCDIKDYRDNLEGYDFIYNRLGDFYFTGDSSTQLRSIFEQKKACISPSPFEYFLLADKDRMIGLSSRQFVESYFQNSKDVAVILSHTPQTRELNPHNADELWASRKSLFFKPKNSYGSKQVYRGAKISRQMYHEITPLGFIAQEFIPAAEMTFDTPEGPQKFKYDLRFYTYRDRIQSVVARIYQGQVTNLQTKYGGFAPVILIP